MLNPISDQPEEDERMNKSSLFFLRFLLDLAQKWEASMNRTELLLSQSNKKILILDGAMGTMIQRYQLTEKDFRTAEL